MQVQPLMEEIDGRIDRLMPESGAAAALYGMMQYHLGWVDEDLQPARADAGKRIRATLCLLACQAVGAPARQALAPATAVELVHNFSLIHDDIQDRSEYRRHRRTVWAIWGAAQAINAGDSMLSLAQLALLEDEGSDPRVVCRALRSINRSCMLLCEGQYLDLDFERRQSVTLVDYRAMIERKTGALITTSCYLGALYGGADDATLQTYSDFGAHVGRAFQIRDDYLGIWGDPEETGKSTASDLASKKKTLPLLYAVDAAGGEDRADLDAILSHPGPSTEAEIARLLGILDRCGAAGYAAEEARRATQAALETLDSLRPQPEAGEELASLCRRLSVRRR